MCYMLSYHSSSLPEPHLSKQIWGSACAQVLFVSFSSERSFCRHSIGCWSPTTTCLCLHTPHCSARVCREMPRQSELTLHVISCFSLYLWILHLGCVTRCKPVGVTLVCVHRAYWSWRFIPSPRYGKVSAIKNKKQNFMLVFFPPSSSTTFMVHILSTWQTFISSVGFLHLLVFSLLHWLNSIKWFTLNLLVFWGVGCCYLFV